MLYTVPWFRTNHDVRCRLDLDTRIGYSSCRQCAPNKFICLLTHWHAVRHLHGTSEMDVGPIYGTRPDPHFTAECLTHELLITSYSVILHCAETLQSKHQRLSTI